jgi:hypothetical protein
MAIETRERRIGATTYRVTQLPAKPGRAMLVRYIRLAGPGAGAFVGGLSSSKAGTFDGSVGGGIAEAIHDFTTRISDAELDAICDEFARYTIVVKSRDVELKLSDVFDDHFAAKYDEMWAWLRFCSEVNFASFFAVSSTGKAGLLNRVMGMVSAWQSQQASIGISTESPPQGATKTP